ncbi:hypothetical protein NMG60_11007515 [Bertholletia excelsa]
MGSSSSSKPSYLLCLTVRTRVIVLVFLLCQFQCCTSAAEVYTHNLSAAKNTSSRWGDNVIEMVYRRHETGSESLSKDVIQILEALFEELAAESSRSKFYETSVGDENIAIWGLFQCRHDLSKEECEGCVNRIPQLMKNNSMNKNGKTDMIPFPAQIHTWGCYIRYKAEEHDEYKVQQPKTNCGPSISSVVGFEEEREGAFTAAESAVVSVGNTYLCDITYKSMHVVAQCQANLEACQCSHCVNNAFKIALDQCPYSLSAHVYLDTCFIRYDYGNINNVNQGGGGGGGGVSAKLAAIVAGGAVALLIGLMFLYFIRAGGKREEW